VARVVVTTVTRATWGTHDLAEFLTCTRPGRDGDRGQSAVRNGRLPSSCMDYLVTAAASRVTAVCASARPLILAPVLKAIRVLHRMMPLKLEVVPRVV